MVSGVLTLAERSIRSIMTPRTDVSWINIDDDPETIRRQLTEAPHSFFPVCRVPWTRCWASAAPRTWWPT